MSGAEVETQSRVAYDALNRIDQGVVHRDTTYFDPANRQILQMNQSQRDLVETEMEREPSDSEQSRSFLSQ
ncbi:MAG: hypothetical protein IT342_08855 [Candidatus Melainabacteria bacterium]|nr:hypothetical protein [Candidatus Melainabacteria bacterium]